MRGLAPMRPHIRIPIAAKFGVMLAVVMAALLAVGAAGINGLANLDKRVRALYGDHIVTLSRTAAVTRDTTQAANVALQIILSKDRRDIASLERRLATEIVPAVDSDIEALRAAHAHDPIAERTEIERLATDWARFLALRATTRLAGGNTTPTASRHDEVLAREIRAIFNPIERETARATSVEAAHAAALAREAAHQYGASRDALLLIGGLALLFGATVAARMVRAVVPRVRRYSDFATEVASGAATNRVPVLGSDELSELGVSLNRMVERSQGERELERVQAEFAEGMQLAETEDEAHHLLKRQIERSIANSRVVILNRNNSADRLQATTPVERDSPLSPRLENAKPRTCLAVRFARTHEESVEADRLVSCDVCGAVAPHSTCQPLLVSGEVIGSVLAMHEHPLSESEANSLRRSVTQAAPVLANLRNLAIAELRAATDALTGLPNSRNANDTVRRMAAHASRTVTPLAALAIDLDHFKQINDTYGHGVGDEVLAAVASTLTGTLRENDFAARIGGEEFLVLLPDTGVEGAESAAEKIRVAVASIMLPAVERKITASLGIAVLPDHAGDAPALLRHADRALYAAKRAGRNRTEIFARGMLPGEQPGDGAEVPVPPIAVE